LLLQPDVLFFDIRMPGQSGLDAAVALAEEWDTSEPANRPFPALVFVTAYDQYALQAFEAQALDYLLKPVQAARLQKTVTKLQAVLASRQGNSQHFETTLAQLRGLLANPDKPATSTLKTLQVSVGNSIHMLALSDVLYFEAADKYVRVLSAEHEYLIRTPLKELLTQLDAELFWQIHRGTVVNSSSVHSVTRDESGKLWLQLRQRPERLAVSRLYAYLFKAM
jgi:DNA-binding LytR/AlgR family response regulator